MQLTFQIQKSSRKGKVPVEVILRRNSRIIGREKMESADKVLEGLDRILKRSKIEMTNIIGLRPTSRRLENIKTIDLNKNRYTSYRILKSIEKALKLKLL